MPSPACTITGTIQSLNGAADQGYAVIQLENFGKFIPKVSGTSLLVNTQWTAQCNASGVFSVTLWGNDVITPNTTYYTVRLYSANQDQSTALPYLFTGAGGDLSSLITLATPPSAPLFNSLTPFTPIAHTYLSGISAAGVWSSSQPAFTDISGLLGISQISASGSPNNTTFLRGDGVWVTTSGSGGAVTSFNTRTGDVVSTSGDYSVAQITGAAPLASPTFTGSPAAPTQSTGDNSTKLATTAFVKAQGYITSTPVSSVFTRTGAVVATSGDYTVAQVTGAAPLASPALTGTPTAPTPLTADNSTTVATTAYVQAQGYLTSAPATTHLLNFQKQTSPITPASNTETAIYSYTIPANTFQLGSGIRISCVIAHTTGATSTNYKCEFGGSGTVTLQSGATGGQLAQWNLVIMQDAVSANTQYITRLQSSNAAGVIVVPLAPVTATETTSGAITVQITAAATGGADSYTGYVFVVEQLI